MKLRGWPVRSRRILAVTASCAALVVISCRSFVWPGTSLWNGVLLLVQGAAMLTAWLAWRSLSPPRDKRGVDRNARRLHW